MLFEAGDRVLRQEAREEAIVIDFDRSCDLGHSTTDNGSLWDPRIR
jgi:hypothetical protein